HHNETQAGSSPLDLLGQAIATHFDCRYLPTLLRKTHPAQSNKTLDLAERQAQLQNLYRLVPQPELTPHTPLLLIDDILTTGTTIRSIIDALPPNSFQIFTLAIADGDKYPSPRPTP
ncbi:MAG TPA: hypothetical protein VI233_13335, partial [Puia sp.]